MLRKVT